jgi:predicted HicB family RNase H-like nuclease
MAEAILVRVSEEIHAWLVQLAKDDDRSINKIVTRMLEAERVRRQSEECASAHTTG